MVNNPYWLKKCTSQQAPNAGSNAFYDDMGKYWEASHGDSRQSLMLDFGKPVEISGYKYHTGTDAGGHCPREIQVSFTDGLDGDPNSFGTKWSVISIYEGPVASGWQVKL